MVSAFDRAYRTNSSKWIANSFKQSNHADDLRHEINGSAREKVTLADSELDAVCKRAEQAVAND
jgi:hypothetical protein